VFCPELSRLCTVGSVLCLRCPIICSRTVCGALLCAGRRPSFCAGRHYVQTLILCRAPLCADPHSVQGGTMYDPHCVQGATMYRPSFCAGRHYVQTLMCAGRHHVRPPLCPGRHYVADPHSVQGGTMCRPSFCAGRHYVQTLTLCRAALYADPHSVHGATMCRALLNGDLTLRWAALCVLDLLCTEPLCTDPLKCLAACVLSRLCTEPLIYGGRLYTEAAYIRRPLIYGAAYILSWRLCATRPRGVVTSHCSLTQIGFVLKYVRSGLLLLAAADLPF
jgi:hypothetical protein